MKDDAIVGLFRDRNEDAIAEAKRAYGDYCVYIARNLLRDEQDAEACLNDVLLAAWKSIPPQEPTNLRTYLGKLTRETAVDRLRKRGARKRTPDGATASLDELEEIVGEGGAEDAVEEAELSRAVSAFLRSLGKEERDLFIRRYWYYDSVKSICERYGYGKSRVLVSLKRTRDKLARYLKKEGFLS